MSSRQAPLGRSAFRGRSSAGPASPQRPSAAWSRAGGIEPASAAPAVAVPRQAASTFAVRSHRASLPQHPASRREHQHRQRAQRDSAGSPSRASCAAGTAATTAFPAARTVPITVPPPAAPGPAPRCAAAAANRPAKRRRPAGHGGQSQRARAPTAQPGTPRRTGPGHHPAATGPRRPADGAPQVQPAPLPPVRRSGWRGTRQPVAGPDPDVAADAGPWPVAETVSEPGGASAGAGDDHADGRDGETAVGDAGWRLASYRADWAVYRRRPGRGRGPA